jgi:hypothetical protein
MGWGGVEGGMPGTSRTRHHGKRILTTPDLKHKLQLTNPGHFKNNAFQLCLQYKACSTKIEHNFQSKHDYIFHREISYMFRLNYEDIIRMITEIKKENFKAV